MGGGLGGGPGGSEELVGGGWVGGKDDRAGRGGGEVLDGLWDDDVGMAVFVWVVWVAWVVWVVWAEDLVCVAFAPSVVVFEGDVVRV